MAEKVNSFAPIIPSNPKVLILGSMPGGLSLEKQEYYGNPRNHFWDILFTLYSQEKLEDYEDKITFVKRRGIALWDAIGTCSREGSLDSNIVDAEPNNIEGLLQRFPTIKLIVCNGTKSYQVFKKYFSLNELHDVNVVKLPSTSPIPGRYNKTFAGKVEEWKIILEYM
ncbi:DNA-deoxyinosine glycosylase [Virgibacillus byunsanensis]|uniref:DNA-deoxyinosine glycosylase n=1 Tax=Virgibacillus byunsanensis TaxID=570945 RepID=A0ABW3LS73_9BACI